MNKETHKHFSLKSENKPVWPDSEALISSSLGLISQNNSSKRFKEFLTSPFFVKDGDELLSLFSYLYPKLAREEQTEVRLTDLLWVVFKSRDLKKHGRAMRKLIKELHREIFRFNAYYFLEEKPEEMARLRTLSLRNKGLSEHYREEQKEWQRQAELLPSGTKGAVHRWEAKDAGYIGLDIPKSKFDAEWFGEVWKSLSAFYHLQLGLYRLEIARRTVVKDSLKELTQKGIEEGREADLIRTYTNVVDLLESEGPEQETYAEIKRSFLREGAAFDVEHQLAAMIGLLNYLQDLLSKGDFSLRSEMYFWPHLMLRSGSYKRVPVISKRLFNNQVYRALVNDQMWLAEQLRDKLFPLVPISNRNFVREHLDLAFTFCRGNHEEVIERTHEASMARFHVDNHDEVIRMKSFYLRSLLVCYYRDPTNFYYGENIRNGLKALDKYLDKISRLELVNFHDSTLRHRRFRSAVRYIFDYLKRSQVKKASTDKIVHYLKEDKPLVCRKWLQDFVEEIS